MLSTSLYMALVLGLGVGAQWLAWRTRMPAIVLLLALGFGLGIAVGPPERFLEEKAFLPLVSLAVGVILFEGGLSLQFKEVLETRGVVLRLVTVGLLVTWGGATLAAHWLMGFGWPMATLLGALLTVSGPTVILPLLRQVRPIGRVGPVIKWEGIVNDPIGAMLAALVFELVAHGSEATMAWDSAWILARTLLVGIALGGGVAWLVIHLLQHYLVPDYLQNAVVLGLVVLVFAVSNALASESGLVSVTVMGIVLANQSRASVKHVVEFKENLRVLLIAVLFILLSSRVQFGLEEAQKIGWGGPAFVAALILVVRPVATFVATLGSDLSRNERLLLAWIHPRGIVAAAVASLFALGLEETELGPDADRLVLTTFLVIVGTVLTYGLTLGPVAQRLGLSREDPQGVLFAGSAQFARQLADALGKEGVDAVLVDTNPQSVQTARMAGLRAHYASIGSEFVTQGLDLGGIGRLLALTPNDEVNSIASVEFRELFGRENVYQLAPTRKASERHRRIPHHLRGRLLFGDGVTYDELRQRLEAGAQIKKTTLGEGFTIDNFYERHGATALVLCKFLDNGRVRFATEDQPLDLKAGGKILALVDPREAPAVTNADGLSPAI